MNIHADRRFDLRIYFAECVLLIDLQTVGKKYLQKSMHIHTMRDIITKVYGVCTVGNTWVYLL